MGRSNYLQFIVLLGVLLFAGCSGGGTSLEAPALQGGNAILEDMPLEEGLFFPVLGSEAGGTVDSGFAGLPSIPLDVEDTGKSSSLSHPDQPDVRVVLGKDFLQMQGGYVRDTALILGAGQDRNLHLSYGLYKVSGLVGKRPLMLNIECVPAGLDNNYFVGLADYTDGMRKWFGPVNLPEFEIDLRNNDHQFVTHLGNMYFVIVCNEGNGATHYQTTVHLGPGGSDTQPGCPYHLRASDGQFPNAIKLDWQAGRDVRHYQVFRSHAGGDRGDPNRNGDWVRIGETMETHFVDRPVPNHTRFLYKVRSANANGHSCWSNIDSGFAAGQDDRPHCSIEGFIGEGGSNGGTGHPLPRIKVFLVGLGNGAMTHTNEHGQFHFGDLPPGTYFVVPFDPRFDFHQQYERVELAHTTTGCNARVSFDATQARQHDRVWGFVFEKVDDNTSGGHGGLLPFADVDVWANHTGHPDIIFGAASDRNGYYSIGIGAAGPYHVYAQEHGYLFHPEKYDVFIGGEDQRNPPYAGRPLIFVGVPDNNTDR